MTDIDYNRELYRHYHAGRALDASARRLWKEILRRHQPHCTGVVLDLGAGTGRFSSLLAEVLPAKIIGVEPSEQMCRVAVRENRHRQVQFVSGTAEAIPLKERTCHLAWLSQILHHLRDLDAAVAELQRVIRPEGRVIIRGNFRGRLKGFCRYYDFFPSGLQVDEARHPGVDEVRRRFEERGFRCLAFETIEQREAASLREYRDRILLRTYSTFELISDEDFSRGIDALNEAICRQDSPQPVTALLDVLVLERG